MKPTLVYGANGRMGSYVAKELVRAGLPIIVAGRDRELVAATARTLSVDARVGRVDEAGSLVAGIGAVVNCAGPFVDTARALAEACVVAGVDYLDLSAERTAITSLLALHRPAKRAKVKILPAAAATGALGAWARAFANDKASTPLREVDISYAHGSAGFMRPTAATLQSFAKEVLQMLLPENGGYRHVPRRVLFPPPFGLGHAIQTRGPDDIALPEDAAPANIRTWLSVDPGTVLNVLWTAFHEPSLSQSAGPALTALWRAAATADRKALGRLLPPGEDAPFSVVLESNGPRVAIAAPRAQEATARIVELCLGALGDTDVSGVLSPASLIPARVALRSLTRTGTIRVFRDDRSQ